MSNGAYGKPAGGKGSGAKTPAGSKGGGKQGLRTTPFQKPLVSRKIGR